LFALLQELSASQADSATRLILACEEPEVHQHPPQAKHLALVLERLITKNSQVLVCTHSPYFISGRGFEDVRLVRKDKRLQETLVGRVRLDELATRISGALGCDPPASSVLELKVEQTLQVNLNEMFFATVLILVEGIEDEAYLRSYLALLDKLEEFRACGCHIVAVGGKNKMIQPLAIAKLLEVPTFVIFDADTDECKNKEKTEQQRRDNLAILRLAGVPKVDPLSLANYVDGSVCMWATNMGDEIKAEIGADKWVELDAAIRKRRGIDSGSFGKNALFIGSMLTEGWGKGLRSKMLELLCHSVLSFASSPGRSNKALAETSGPESAEAV
jgi:putative ATP-dependent endonuclease of OLD family